MHILVTGGAGFIGSHLVQYHLDKGDHVWAVDNLLTGKEDNIKAFEKHPFFRFTQADLAQWPQLLEAITWADRIYHMAAILGQRLVLSNPVDTLSKNIHNCELILQGMTHVNKKVRLLIASSSGVYASVNLKAEETLPEDTILHFNSGAYLQESYYFSKLINEVMGLAYLHQKGIQCTIARIFNTIGTRQTGRYGMVVPTFVEQALKNQPITVYGDGLQTRSFCNVQDTVTALDLIMKNPESNGEIINIGNNDECSINDLAKLVKEKAKSRSEITHLSYKEAYGVDFHDVQVRRPNIDKLKRLTGFQPQWTLEQTVQQIIEKTQASIT